MASFNDLSYHVHRVIIYWFLFKPCHNLYHWKQRLPIIGVCGIWRNIALPTVYRIAYVEDSATYKKTRIENSVNKITKQNHNRRSLKRVNLKSNISLIAFTGLCFLINEVECNIGGSASLLNIFTDLIDLLKNDNTSWHNAQSLIIRVNTTPDSCEGRVVFDPSCNQTLFDILQFFANNFTQVTNLSIYCNGKSLFGDRLCSGLSNMYAHKLQELYCYTPIFALSSYLSPQLSSLTINLKNIDSGSFLLYIFSKTLKRLVVLDVPHNFSWGCFQDQNSPYDTDIWFYQLESLFINPNYSFNERNASSGVIHGLLSGTYYKLHFPKLMALYIRNDFDNSELASANVSDRLSILQLTGTPQCLTKYLFFESAYLKDIWISVEISNLNDLNLLYPFTRSISKNTYQHLERFRIKISASSFPIDFKNVTLPFCTSLGLQCNICFSDFYEYLSRALQLKELFIYKNSLYSLLDTVTLFDISAYDYIDNTDYSVERVYLRFWFDSSYTQKALLLVAFFLVYCRKLKHIQIYELLKPEINQFIDTYKHIYPHIEKPEVAYYLLVEDIAPSEEYFYN